MTADLLFEIGTEEIPAHYMPEVLEQLKEILGTKLTENRIKYEEIRSMGTPRRMAILVWGMAMTQSDISRLVRGPAAKAAYDDKGAPTKALNGFMGSRGVMEKELILKKVAGVEYVFAAQQESGKTTGEILTSLLPEVVYAIDFPKSMRWGDYHMRFARPIRWIVALLGKKIIEFSIEGVTSGDTTRGHRTLSDRTIVLEGATEYIDRLRDEYVIVDPEERKEIIMRQMKELACSRNGQVLVDEGLLTEVVFLVEYPTALMGSFDKDFLALPREVVITPMQAHQRYFPVVDREGKLLPGFITVRNGSDEFIDNVRTGNERVLQARLKDAQFFYLEDLKDGLDTKVEKLKTMVFQDKLGSIYDKTKRISKLAMEMGNKIGFTEIRLSLLERAAYLCKADLVTGMVNEFDELQGIMGREYALNNGEKPEVAVAIASHYLPRHAGDGIPQDILGQVLSVSDKLDSMVGIFGIGIQPSGSQDPYGLRRLAVGIMAVLLDADFHMDIGALVDEAIGLYEDRLAVEHDRLYNAVMDFIRQRFRVGLMEKDFRQDIIDSVLGMGLTDMKTASRKVADLSEIQGRETEFGGLLAALKRVFNLTEAVPSATIDPQIFENESEDRLFNASLKAQEDINRNMASEGFTEVVRALYPLIGPIHDFFEYTRVMVENEAVKRNRLSLLKAVADMAGQVCDFTGIAGA